jgi:hypothetical protein
MVLVIFGCARLDQIIFSELARAALVEVTVYIKTNPILIGARPIELEEHDSIPEERPTHQGPFRRPPRRIADLSRGGMRPHYS